MEKFWVKLQRSRYTTEATTNCMKFRKKSTAPALLFIRGCRIPGVSMRRVTEHVRRNALSPQTSIGKNLCQVLIPYSDRNEEPHIVLSCGKKHHFDAKEYMKKSNRRGKNTSILDRFQRDAVFHASQIQRHWTIEWCKYLDHKITIYISHGCSPEQRERYAKLYHLRYHPKLEQSGYTCLKVMGQCSNCVQMIVLFS